MKQLLGYVVNASFKSEKIDHEKIRIHYISIDEAVFMLSKPTVEYLKECHDACEDLLLHVAKRPGNDLFNTQFAEEASSLNARVRKLYADLPAQFERDLKVVV